MRDSQNFVNASLILVTNLSDTTFKFRYDWQYKEMQNSPNSIHDSAENYALFFMKLDKSVFGHKKFNILDKDLFKKDDNNAILIQLPDSAVNENNLYALPVCNWITVTWYLCDLGKLSTNSGSSENITRCFFTTSYVHCTSGGWGEGGESGGGSSGGSGSPWGGPTGTGGCSGCGGGGGSGTNNNPSGGGWMPVTEIDDDPTSQDPCEIALNKAHRMDSAYAKSNIDSVLATIPNLATETKEKGFPIYKKFTVNSQNVADTTIGKYYAGSVQTGTDSSISMTFNIPYLTLHASSLHTHPPIGYSAHSAKDIYEMIGDQLQSNQYEGSFVAAANGSKYALNVTDQAQAAIFLNTASTFLNGSNWNDTSSIGLAFRDATKFFEDKYNGNPNRDNLAYEMAMSAVLTQFNTGVTLSKRDSFGKFIPIKVNTMRNPNRPRRKIYVQDCI